MRARCGRLTTMEPPPRTHDHATTPPAALAWVDGRVVPATEATVPLTDDGFLRGDAVFEAMLVRAGRTHAREQHLARMARSATTVQLPLPAADIARAIDDLLRAWGAHDGSIKVIATRGGLVRGLIGGVHWPPTVQLQVIEMPWRTALSGVKTLSYAANQWALRQARMTGADDALLVDDGLVHELPTGAVVLVHDGSCSTPDPTRMPILSSVSVEVLRRIVEVTPAMPDLAALARADEVFIVSATRPCLPVHAVQLPDGTRLELPAPGPVTAALQARLEEHLLATLDPAPGD